MADGVSQTLPGNPCHIAWDRGRTQIWPLGAAIHHLTLSLADGREIAPLAEAPWHDDPTTTGDASIPAHLRHLGGEWPCVPFGRTEADPVAHGFGTDNLWRLVRAKPHETEWEIAYPTGHPIERLTRTVSGVPGQPAVAFTLSVAARQDCTLPVGLHPIVKLPEAGEESWIEADFSHGETFPVMFEKGVSRLAPRQRFDSLDALPLAAGGTTNLTRLCHEQTEEAFQIFGVAGSLRLVYPRQRYAVRLGWNAADFPTCLFWLSSDGRQHRPWSGRFRGLGVEPLAARFEEQDGTGTVAGGRTFRAGEIWTTSYSLMVETLAEERT